MKNLLRNLTRFDGGLFELEIIEISTTAFLLKTYLNLNFFQVLQSALVKIEKKFYQKRCKQRKNRLTFARDRSKTLKKRKKHEKWEKVKEKQIFFYLYLFIQKNFYFVRKHIGKTLYWYICINSFFSCQVIGNAVTKD